MKLSRRRLVQSLGFAASNALLPMPVFAQSRVHNELRIAPLHTGEMSGGSLRYDLQLQAGSRQFLGGLNTPTIGINGSFLGPTIRLRNGSDVAMSVLNNLNEPSTLHWHGLHVPAKGGRWASPGYCAGRDVAAFFSGYAEGGVPSGITLIS